jgi:hypothetical protein
MSETEKRKLERKELSVILLVFKALMKYSNDTVWSQFVDISERTIQGTALHEEWLSVTTLVVHMPELYARLAACGRVEEMSKLDQLLYNSVVYMTDGGVGYRYVLTNLITSCHDVLSATQHDELHVDENYHQAIKIYEELLTLYSVIARDTGNDRKDPPLPFGIIEDITIMRRV